MFRPDGPIWRLGDVFSVFQRPHPPVCDDGVFAVTPFVHVQIKYGNGRGDKDDEKLRRLQVDDLNGA